MISLRSEDFAGLLELLSSTRPLESGQHGVWAFARVSGGANNLVYRVQGSGETCAVKFCLCDARGRAGREYGALALLEKLGPALSPKAFLLERERYALPVVVQSWLDGEVMRTPVTVGDWETLLNYYAALHRVTPAHTEQTGPTLPHALHTASSLAHGRALVRGQLEHLPEAAYPNGLKGVLARFEAWPGPSWPQPRLALCRVDPNPSNFIRTEGGLRSVDWENSGWGDPAFEIADLLAHPAYGPVSVQDVLPLAERYAERLEDSSVVIRITAYFGICLVYWVARFARTLYEVPRGLDARLVARPETWQADTRLKYRIYLQRAESFISSM